VQYGPLSGFGTWAFERNNGVLSRVNNNRRTVDISITLVRNWRMQARLMAIVNNPAPDATPEELAALESMKPTASPESAITIEDTSMGYRRTMTLPKPIARFRAPNLETELKCYKYLLDYLEQMYPHTTFGHYADADSDTVPVPVSYVANQPFPVGSEYEQLLKTDTGCVFVRSYDYRVYTHVKFDQNYKSVAISTTYHAGSPLRDQSIRAAVPLLHI
jgi:hypothetical protein